MSQYVDQILVPLDRDTQQLPFSTRVVVDIKHLRVGLSQESLSSRNAQEDVP